jgi:hypothetical protein
MPLKVLIMRAYDVQNFQVSGPPGWMDSQRFDIIAKVPDGAGGPPLEPSRGRDGLLRTPHGQLGIQATANDRMRMQGDAVTMARLTEVL